jgi:hypothetical protein
MAEQKTKATTQSVEQFLDAVSDEKIRDDCYALVQVMKKATGCDPKMWGPSIIGFGSYHYRYDSGHEGDACLTGFSPRKQNITLYIMPGSAQHDNLLEKLGKYKAGKGCVYIKKLEDINVSALESLVGQSVTFLRSKYSN